MESAVAIKGTSFSSIEPIILIPSDRLFLYLLKGIITAFSKILVKTTPTSFSFRSPFSAIIGMYLFNSNNEYSGRKNLNFGENSIFRVIESLTKAENRIFVS